MKKKCISNFPPPVCCASVNNYLKIIGFFTWVELSFIWNINGINSWDANHEALSLLNNYFFKKLLFNLFTRAFITESTCTWSCPEYLLNTSLLNLYSKPWDIFSYPRLLMILNVHCTSIVPSILIPFLPKHSTRDSLYYICNIFCLWLTTSRPTVGSSFISILTLLIFSNWAFVRILLLVCVCIAQCIFVNMWS